MEEKQQTKFWFTNHATERVYELGISFDKALWLAHHAVPDIPDKSREAYKREKYGYHQHNIFYLAHRNILFTCVKEFHKKTEEPIILILTVTDKSRNIGAAKALENNFHESKRNKKFRKVYKGIDRKSKWG